MPPRKPIPSHEKPRFTPHEIISAIKAVEAAGLEVYAVEITPTGAIKISTERRRKPASISADPPGNEQD